jgi:predicted GIY-YIG superfamily endonuclease
MTMGIYRINNRVNHKVYIGSTSNTERRWAKHLNDLRNGKHTNRDMQHDWSRYGEGAFDLEIVELVEDPQDLLQRERFWIIESIRDGICYNMPELAHSGISEASLPVALLFDEIALLRQAREDLEGARHAYAVARRELPRLAAIEQGNAGASMREFSVMLTLALSIHKQVRSNRPSNPLPWVVKSLQGDRLINGVFICRLTQDDAALLGRMLERLGLVADRQPRQPGRWVPKTTDDVIALVSGNWDKVSGMSSAEGDE